MKLLHYLAGQLLPVLGDNQILTLVGERHMMKKRDDIPAAPPLEERIDKYWAKVFCLKSVTGEVKYPLLATLFKALLSLPHGYIARIFFV